MISNNQWKKIQEMKKKWKNFLKLRNAGDFDYGPANGWITMIDRENMLDQVLGMF